MSNFAIKQRMFFIDSLVDHYGYINRAVLMDFFGISEPQASIDLREYMKIAPTNLVYSLSEKAYKKSSLFERI